MLSKILDDRDWKQLLFCIGGSFMIYHGARKLNAYLSNCKEEWIPVGRVAKLNVYPIKSASGNSVFSLYCGELGARHGDMLDRHFMVVNTTTAHFYTGRQIPEILKIQCQIQDGIVSLQCDESSISFSVESVIELDTHLHVTLFDDNTVESLHCGEKVEKWIQKALGQSEVALVMFHDKLHTNRLCVTQPLWVGGKRERIDKTAFADMAPYLIASRSSLDDLNSRLDKKLTLRSFRPNIEVEFSAPWAEDKWDKIKMGDTVLQLLHPCGRCIFTTIDPDNLERSKEMQPLTALKTFRSPTGETKKSVGESPAFGVNAAVIRKGYCCVGDIIYATMDKSYLPEYK